MTKQLKYLYKKTALKYPLYPFKFLYDVYRFKLLSDSYYISEQYKKKFNVYPDLKHPKTLNEKIQWLKLNERTPLHTMCADKYKVQDYVREKIGDKYLIPLVFETKNVNDICEKNMPNYPVIIKTNHDSSGGIIIKDRTNHNWEETQRRLRKLLKINYYYPQREWPYKNIERRIIVERLLIAENGGIPFDYKVHCFNGKPQFIQVDLDRMGEHSRNLFTPLWEKMEVGLEYPLGEGVKKPIHLDKLLQLASELAKEFTYARVDLYAIHDEIYFGEITFHPGGGLENFSPSEWDLKFGNKLKLPLDA
jgi:hypothetical protein